MALTAEWRKRIERWISALEGRFYLDPHPVEMSGLVTKNQLTAEEAAERDFRPMPPGSRWGGKWEYGWFKGRYVVPEAAAGRRVVFCFGGGGEALIFVNGRAAGSSKRLRRPVTLTSQAKAGQEFDILVEAYAGHGPTRHGVGPVAWGQQSIPESPETQQEVQPSTAGVWAEDAYQLWLDVRTLLELRDSAEADSLRVAEIDEALRDFTVIVDLELPAEEVAATIRAGRERLRPLLECVNGSTAPTMFAFGHGHLDVAWLWPLAETERKAARTLANQLALAAEYPQYRFLHSQAHLLATVKRLYPALYQRVKAAVAKGNIIPEGGMWVEADTNITGGESLIRQFLHGKRFFRDEFGVDCELLWLPDVFGYSGALPQIMAGCGVRYFSTQKIFWTYKGGQTFPYNTFTWEGIDGTGVLAHMHNDYNSQTSPAHVIQRWRERVQKDGLSTRLMPFGWGDGGGGPDRDHVEFALRQKDLEGSPRVRLSGPVEYFKDLQRRGPGDLRYVGELYLQCHRGTYTSQARTKRGNRKCELALREAEMWSVGAAGALKFPAAEMEDAWKKLLVNQFHDILPGSSITRVYEEAQADHADVLAAAERVIRSATSRLTDGTAEAMTVFNSLSWPRTALLELPEGFAGARDANGDALCVQGVGSRRIIEVNVPACGWTTIRLSPGETAGPPPAGADVLAADRSLENELLRLRFDEFGRIVSIFDKVASRELAAGPCNELRMFKDVPGGFDAWDLDRTYACCPVELAEKARFEVLSAGTLTAGLRISRKLNNSEMTQTVTMRRGTRRVDFQTAIDWQERHKVLKVAFNVDYHANEAVHEIQFGHIRRPNHYSEPLDFHRYEVCNHKWSALVEANRGFAVLNDCKYGLNVLGGSINLTLLRSTLAPDPQADRGLQEFTYSFYCWDGPLFDSGVVRQAYELNCPVRAVAGSAGEKSLLSVDVPNVIVETVKPAEDGGGDVIVRLYECMRTATRCTLSTALAVKSAALTDMMEENPVDVPVNGGKVAMTFRPFEIKTLRLKI